jgi:hypothetical protein
LRLVSVLPDGEASNLENTTGGPANEVYQLDQGRTESLENAVSADGTKVFWTASNIVDAETPGALYLRLNPGAEPTASGECDEAEPEKACTVLVSAGPARFWTADTAGSIAIFSVGGALDEYEVATGETRSIAPQVLGVLGASKDAARVYFISEAEIGGEGTAGEPNLYLYEREGATTFIATLSDLDASQKRVYPSPGNVDPIYHTARVTPDGAAVAFMSNDPQLAEEVAGYDNTDQAGGTPAAEIYRYGVGGELACISCNRSGSRPTGRQIQNKRTDAAPLYAASMLPGWLNSLYAPRVLSDDGNRIFFEAFEALTPTDVNGKADVYQWEAKGTGTCDEADSAYDPQSEGCVSLLSSGTDSSSDAKFVDASPSGNDVFIRTAASLVSWDPGEYDIYDARVNGGFAAPPQPPAPCEGEKCQPEPPAAPASPAPGSANPGQGNPRQAGRHCPKGRHEVKRKGKVRCVKNKKHHKKHHNRAHTSRRAGR